MRQSTHFRWLTCRSWACQHKFGRKHDGHRPGLSKPGKYEPRAQERTVAARSAQPAKDGKDTGTTEEKVDALTKVAAQLSERDEQNWAKS